MALRLEITTLGGRQVQLAAREDWCVWDVKRAVRKVWQVQASKQRLLDDAGVEFLEGRVLQDFCAEGQKSLHLSLVLLAKAPEELEWEAHWAQVVPEWLQHATTEVLSQHDFGVMRSRAKREHLCPFHPDRSKVYDACSCRSVTACMPRFTEASDDATSQTRMLTCDELLEILRARPREVRESDGKWLLGHDAATERVVKEAMARDPEVVLPHLPSDAWVMDLLKTRPGIFHLLPENFQESRSLLYAALEVDEELQAWFMRTAAKNEINAWRWEQEGHNVGAKHKAGKRRGR